MASTAETLPHKHRLTRDEYYRMAETGILAPDARVELVEGEIIDMAPIGSPHAARVSRLAKIFTLALAERAIVNVQNPLVLNEYSEPEPDITVLRYREDFYAGGHPRPEDVLLVIEVADTSLQYDRDVKLPLYAAHGIPEYWLVDLPASGWSSIASRTRRTNPIAGSRRRIP
jgi:Uma2 family endonuclease